MHSQFTSTKWAKSQHESFQMAWRASQHITLKLPKNIGPPPHRKGNSEESDTDFGFDSTDSTKCVEPENHQCRRLMMPHFRICSGRSNHFKPIVNVLETSAHPHLPVPRTLTAIGAMRHVAESGRQWDHFHLGKSYFVRCLEDDSPTINSS